MPLRSPLPSITCTGAALQSKSRSARAVPLRSPTSLHSNRPRLLALLLLLAISLCLVNAVPADDLKANGRESLAEVQALVVQAVRQNMETCVAISDGMGFGSGVIVSADGLILTAGHVVSTGVEEFELFFPSGRTAQARLVGYNLDVDAAMLQIQGTGTWAFASLADEATPVQGSWTIGLGHSGGYELGRKPPVRTGRLLEIREHMLVTDSALIGGDSGGPLFNLNGELIGIHSSIGDVISENRHVSLATFRQHWDRMRKGERWGRLPDLETSKEDENGSQSTQPSSPNQRPDLSDKSESVARGAALLGVAMDDANQNGLAIGRVETASPAARVGLKPGDVILSINGTPARNGDELQKLLLGLVPGGTAELQVRRGSSAFRLLIILDKL